MVREKFRSIRGVIADFFSKLRKPIDGFPAKLSVKKYQFSRGVNKGAIAVFQ